MKSFVLAKSDKEISGYNLNDWYLLVEPGTRFNDFSLVERVFQHDSLGDLKVLKTKFSFAGLTKNQSYACFYMKTRKQNVKRISWEARIFFRAFVGFILLCSCVKNEAESYKGIL